MNMFKTFREIYTKTANAIMAEYPDCRVTNAFVYAPAEFPCAAIVMSDDGMTRTTRDSSHADKFRDITATVDVYSDKLNTKKTEAEDIMQIVIDTLSPLNFTLATCRPASNINNASNYRITATFTATVDSNGTIYSRR